MIHHEKKAVEYKVLEVNGKISFQELCTELLKKGYEPIGGMCYFDGDRFYQSFIRYETEITDLGPD